ncbi:MAG: YlbF family regulator [Ruminococcus sp.]|uniref:YlbF family regulator n=1 Tax=uncultured Ruminococcus sp. TaxID=165186 RepID=UPI0015650BFF|nr:YlbF family regulator [uncultured Ruminococcus sp.]MCR4861754.1 YlbF family regulator [Ruminococcus sp.]
MDVIELTRELGKAIQQDDRYIAYMLAKQVNDNDKELNEDVEKFSKLREELNEVMKKDVQASETDHLKELDENIKATYKKIMSNKNMVVFQAAQKNLEDLINNVQQIITMCANGEDPETCQPSSGCSGSCATCGGCG